jgi:hypothetical protein
VSNPSKQRGTAAETAWVNYLRRRGWHAAERRALAGNKDLGDVAGIPLCVHEVKAHKVLDLSTWVREMQAEMVNARATTGAVVHKRRGTTDPAEWYVTLTGRLYLDLLAAAGYRAHPGHGDRDGDAA